MTVWFPAHAVSANEVSHHSGSTKCGSRNKGTKTIALAVSTSTNSRQVVWWQHCGIIQLSCLRWRWMWHGRSCANPISVCSTPIHQLTPSVLTSLASLGPVSVPA